ncbi:MAG: hypothetical protein LBU74_04015, partial [Methanobacteriaceae archaeon]|nr:hypothetical protein [Candidatus Methanorudis spinitermitis]
KTSKVTVDDAATNFGSVPGTGGNPITRPKTDIPTTIPPKPPNKPTTTNNKPITIKNSTVNLSNIVKNTIFKKGVIIETKKKVAKYKTVTPPKYCKGKFTNGYMYCSCGKKGYGYGRWKVTFVDKCAHASDKSHKSKSTKLLWSTKKTAIWKEGEWICKGCRADYCAVCGKEKFATRNKYLTRVKMVKLPK